MQNLKRDLGNAQEVTALHTTTNPHVQLHAIPVASLTFFQSILAKPSNKQENLIRRQKYILNGQIKCIQSKVNSVLNKTIRTKQLFCFTQYL